MYGVTFGSNDNNYIFIAIIFKSVDMFWFFMLSLQQIGLWRHLTSYQRARKAWQVTPRVYNCQWTRGALNLKPSLVEMISIWVGTPPLGANRVWHVNSVWNFPGKSEFRGRVLERVNRIPSFIRPFPEAISRRGKRELRYFLIRCIWLNALSEGKILFRNR